MNTKARPIETLLKVVVKHGDIEKLIAGIEHQQREDSDTCLTAREIAAHFIVDLYSETSSDTANLNRITVNLEAVANQLLSYSRLFKALEQASKREEGAES